MKCCPHCFSDIFLNSRIENMSNEMGRCSYCRADNVTIISPESLTDYFESLLEIYVRDSNGQALNELIQDDWQVFATTNTSVHQKLLRAILQVSHRDALRYKPSYTRDDTTVKKWHLFTAELKGENRFIPQNAPERAPFVDFGRFLGVVYKKHSQRMYRARICDEGKKFLVKDLRKPPANMVLNGRANPVGIPYLYVASTPKTAIAEVRGHKGEKVTVLEFEIKNDLNLFDLRHPRQTISPFEQIDDLEFIYRYMPYLELLESELSKPVIPKKANLEYLASQYLCELIKQMNYHGIIYKSSIDMGNNYVIFNDNRLKAGSIKEYAITEMQFLTEPKT